MSSFAAAGNSCDHRKPANGETNIDDLSNYSLLRHRLRSTLERCGETGAIRGWDAEVVLSGSVLVSEFALLLPRRSSEPVATTCPP